MKNVKLFAMLLTFVVVNFSCNKSELTTTNSNKNDIFSFVDDLGVTYTYYLNEDCGGFTFFGGYSYPPTAQYMQLQSNQCSAQGNTYNLTLSGITGSSVILGKTYNSNVTFGKYNITSSKSEKIATSTDVTFTQFPKINPSTSKPEGLIKGTFVAYYGNKQWCTGSFNFINKN